MEKLKEKEGIVMTVEEINKLFRVYQPALADTLCDELNNYQALDFLLWRMELLTINHIKGLDRLARKYGLAHLVHHIYLDEEAGQTWVGEKGVDIGKWSKKKRAMLPPLTLTDVQEVAYDLKGTFQQLDQLSEWWDLSEAFYEEDPYDLLERVDGDEIQSALLGYFLDDLGVYHYDKERDHYTYYQVPEDQTVADYLGYRFEVQAEDPLLARVVKDAMDNIDALNEYYETYDEETLISDEMVMDTFNGWYRYNEEEIEQRFEEAKLILDKAVINFYQEYPVEPYEDGWEEVD